MKFWTLALFGSVLSSLATAQDGVIPPPDGGWPYQNCMPLNYPPAFFAKGFPYGSEDVSEWKEGVFFVSGGLNGANGPLDPATYNPSAPRGPAPYAAGGIYALDVSDTSHPMFVGIPLEGMPAGLNFRPHGIFVDHDSKRLLVVSHNEEKKEENMVIFTIGDDSSSNIPELKFQVALTSDQWALPVPELYNNALTWVINNVAVVSNDEFLVTQIGPIDPSTIPPDQLNVPKNLWSCPLQETYDSDMKKISCRPAIEIPEDAAALIALNGIAVSDDKKKVWVANQLVQQIIEINRDNNGEYEIAGTISTAPTLPDNVQFIDGKLQAGFTSALLTAEFDKIIGGQVIIEGSGGSFREAQTNFQLDPTFSAANGFFVSVALTYKDILIIGTAIYPGVIICSEVEVESSKSAKGTGDIKGAKSPRISNIKGAKSPPRVKAAKS